MSINMIPFGISRLWKSKRQSNQQPRTTNEEDEERTSGTTSVTKLLDEVEEVSEPSPAEVKAPLIPLTFKEV
jgi:hypothetical protein